ncbi:MAG TPA: AraC family transcriptional regulator ligand-binding domain-containing protein [Polyangiales bacterium]|nr:AraC family transcriptional regulator ligand-binding domain-containing protein [Polyangiales bacterium]
MTQGRQSESDALREPAGGRVEPKGTQASLTLWPWVELGRRHGLPIAELADRAGVRVADLRDPGMRFTQPAANRIAQLVCESAGQDAGIKAAEMVEAGHFALIELLARTAPNVGRALAQGARFFSLLHSEVRCLHRVEPDGSHLLRSVIPPGLFTHHGFAELTMAVWTTGLRRETEQPSLEPLQVCFRHPAPQEDLSTYARVLGPRVKFGMPEDRLHFSAAVASLPLTRKNPIVHAAALKAASDFLRTLR